MDIKNLLKIFSSRDHVNIKVEIPSLYTPLYGLGHVLGHAHLKSLSGVGHFI